MTALTEYQRLESTGVWRAAPGDQRRDVFISVGDATLVITDTAERTVAHWSLPAVNRLNPGRTPAVYSPGPDAPEELEIADDTMIEAIETVRRAIARRRPQKGRLRLVLLGGGLVAVLALSVFWLPKALIGHTAAVVPPAKRIDLGERVLTNIRRVAGASCSTSSGRVALNRLMARVTPRQQGRLVVLTGGISGAAHLPGGLILLNRALVEDYEDPAVVAGFILAERVRMKAHDPMLQLLETSGPLAAFRLLTTGDLPDRTLASYAEVLLTRKPDPISDERLLTAFGAARLPSTPYAYALDISGETTLGLIEADPVAPTAGAEVLTDGDWVRLQGICGE